MKKAGAHLSGGYPAFLHFLLQKLSDTRMLVLGEDLIQLILRA